MTRSLMSKLVTLVAATTIGAVYLIGGYAEAGEDYLDPAGRFSLPLPGNWQQIAAQEQHATYYIPEGDLHMHVLTVEASDVGTAELAALQQIGVDQTNLKITNSVIFAGWNINFYLDTDSSGVTAMCQVNQQVSHCLILTGTADLARRPPDSVMTVIQSFSLAGAQDNLPKTVSEFEIYVNELVGKNPPGLSIAIAIGTDVTYQKGFGLADGPRNIPTEADTVFMWASMTKMVTATAIMQLVDQGLVSLDAPVGEYLDYVPKEYGITIRQLLSHSAGLNDPVQLIYGNTSLKGQPRRNADTIARDYYDTFTGLLFKPGKTSSYSTPGVITLGQVIAEVSGQNYVEYVRQHILLPLGMTGTDFFHNNNSEPAKTAVPAVAISKKEAMIANIDAAQKNGVGKEYFRDVDETHAWLNHFRVFGAGSGLIGPATEAIRFIMAHANNGELDGVRILSAEAVAAMREMQQSNVGTPLGWGLGWRINDTGEHPFVEHDGGGAGMSTKMRLYPENGMSIVMMSNAAEWDKSEVADAAANVIFTMMAPPDRAATQAADVLSEIPPIVDANGEVVPSGLALLEEVTLGGIQQAVLIRTQDVTNPVLLILHGGPGTTLIPFIEQIQPVALEATFTVVHWDQRGAGKSYDPSLTLEDLSADKLVSDTIELTNILRQRFGQEKIFLTGHSWGSALGFMAIQQDSSLYHAFIASGERISWSASHQDGFDWVKQQATEQQNAAVLEQIAKIEPFDINNADHISSLYQGLNYFRGGDVYTPGLWDKMLAYALGGKSPYYTKGEIDTYIIAKDLTQKAVEPFATSYDLTKTFTTSDIPIHFIQGEHDHYAPESLSRPFFEALQAPAKSYVVIKDAGHAMMYDKPDDWAAALIDIANSSLAQ